MFSTFNLLLISALISGLNSLEQRDCGRVPFTLYGPSVVYDGKDSLYYVGGYSKDPAKRSFIFRYSINNSTFNLTPLAEFPGTVANGVATLDKNGNIFHFGGSDGSGQPKRIKKDIYRFNIYTLELELLQTKLQVARHHTSSVTVGDSVYIFSGDAFRERGSTFEEFNMVTKTTTLMGNLDLPLYGEDTAAVYDGKYIYIFRHTVYASTIPVLRFDPATQEQKVLKTHVPRVYEHTAVIDRGLAYMVHPQFEYGLMIYNTETDEYYYSEDIRTTGWAYMTSRTTYAHRQNTLILSGLYSDDSSSLIITCVDLPPKPFECTEGNDGLYPHPDCTKFIVCSNAQKHEMDCPTDLHFNPIELFCDYPENANCTV